MYTTQETFDMICEGLKAQNWQRSAVGTQCLYRGPNGRKCAVGLLIPDDDYDKDFEIDASLRQVYNAVPALHRHDIKTLSWIQQRHDVLGRGQTLKQAMKLQAEHKNLEWKYD